MSWHLAKIVYQIICGDGTHLPQFDEQLRLISASNEEEALIKAEVIGHNEEDCFCNDKQQLVQWKFIAVTELHSLNEAVDGAEVYSQIKEVDDAEGYKKFLNHKAKKLSTVYTSANNLQLI